MSKIDTAKKIASLAIKHPLRITGAVRYVCQHGVRGLRDRLHAEIIADELLVSKMNAVPASVNGSICFSVLMPVYNVEPLWLEKAIESVKAQTYANWELCIVDDCSSDQAVHDFLESIYDKQIKVFLLSSNQGISGATNKAAEIATGDYFVLLDNDDELAPYALEELFYRISSTQADVLYSDHEVVDKRGKPMLLYKPNWSPDLLSSQMYLGHLLAFKRVLFESVGGFRSEFDGSQDYDLVLRMSEKTSSIEHIAKVLYSWRSLPSSTATNSDAKPYAQIAGRKALQDHFDRVYGRGATCVRDTDALFVYDTRWALPAQKPLVSIIIPTKDHVDDLIMALESIFMRTTYPNYEIIILDNDSEEKSTHAYFEYLLETHNNVRIERSPYPFNWSKINNQGIEASKGDVIVCLNNDVVIQSNDWLERLAENALREDVGIVGGRLLYPDGTIQHAGVVIGMGGWADHVYKGCKNEFHGTPFISPLVTRNVTAVTGACMAFSRSLIEDIGGFDERFIVCGSDVELCVRALKHGYVNVYNPHVLLTHYESKTRDPGDIPDIDFQLSESLYRTYKAQGDPYYNPNLDYASCAPTVLAAYKRKERLTSQAGDVSVGEARPLKFRVEEGGNLRINLLIPSVNTKDIYGGIATALKLFSQLVERLHCDSRIVVMDCDLNVREVRTRFPEYTIVGMNETSRHSHEIVCAFRRTADKSIAVSENDWFFCTSWWTAYCVQNEITSDPVLQNRAMCHPLIYLIQDYEPGFYPWSSRFLMAESTYKSQLPTIAIFNSSELMQFFREKGYSFTREFVFEPFLNVELKKHLDSLNGKTAKRKQVLVYGRPNTPRNAFELVVESLSQWIAMQDGAQEWEFISAGEEHDAVPLGHGKFLVSVGKLSLDGYARLLAESYAGISLMVSPHPSYPPLEMASFGVQTITNAFWGKNLADFSPCIHSLRDAVPHNVACCLDSICARYRSEVPVGEVPSRYLENTNAFPFMDDLVKLVERDTDKEVIS